MDHEFGSSQLTEQQVGWDWFSVQLHNNYELMLYIIRRKDGSFDPFSSATLVYPDGTSAHVRYDELQVEAHAQWQSPTTQATYPQRWTIQVPKAALTLHLEPVMAAQELVTDNSTRVTYWEGSVAVQGTLQGQAITGVGYVELTGYAQRVNL
jgi:predicted secreted hydrolase